MGVWLPISKNSCLSHTDFITTFQNTLPTIINFYRPSIFIGFDFNFTFFYFPKKLQKNYVKSLFMGKTIAKLLKTKESPIQDIDHPLFSLLKQTDSQGLDYELTIKDHFSPYMAMNLAGMIYDLVKQNPKLKLKIGMLSGVKKVHTPSLIMQ